MQPIAIVIHNHQNLWVDNMWNGSFASTADWWARVTAVSRSSVAPLHPIRLHVSKIREVVVRVLAGGSFEHYVVNTFCFFREAGGQWTYH